MYSGKLIVLGNYEEWCEKSLVQFKSDENVLFFNGLPTNNSVLKLLCKIQYSDRIGKYIHIPFEKILNYLLLRNISQYNEEIVFLIFDRNILGSKYSFLQSIRKKYLKAKIVYIFTNIAKITGASERGYLDKLNDWYDVVFAFDPEDAKKYGFSYSPLIYDADPNYKREEKESKEDLVFYVGQAKDRLTGLLSCFEKLKQLGIKTDFHIANVKEEDIKYSDEIIYNKFMPYAECVDSIQKATCLIDVIQGESTGLTIKTCEAVCYDKKLITTNKHVVEYPFYDPRYIRVVESPDDIDESFFTENKDVHYSEEGKAYFSADSFLKRVEDELKER